MIGYPATMFVETILKLSTRGFESHHLHPIRQLEDAVVSKWTTDFRRFPGSLNKNDKNVCRRFYKDRLTAFAGPGGDLVLTGR
mgnify:CR=1 FL=1